MGLLVNGVSNPLAIDRDSARFTWRSADASRGERQTAYQILVSSSPDRLAADKGDWWDSGKVDSDQSASVEYAGKPCLPATRFLVESADLGSNRQAQPLQCAGLF